MSLSVIASRPPSDVYVSLLSGFIANVSSVLLEQDRWGFGILHDCFGITPDSGLYVSPASPEARRQAIAASGAKFLSGVHPRDEFLAGVGYDFVGFDEPYKTELKAYFAWRLSRQAFRRRSWHERCGSRLLPFIRDLPGLLSSPLPALLVQFGHPLEEGNGNGSSPLRAVMESWLTKEDLSTKGFSQSFVQSDTAMGVRLVSRDYDGPNSMVANDLVRTLILLRERFKPLETRDFILLEDIFPQDELPQTARDERSISFFRFRLPWFRNAARRFVLWKIRNRELAASTMVGFVGRLKHLEDCLRDQHTDPKPGHITTGFLQETFLNWGNDRRLAGKNWYADNLNLVQWASQYIGGEEWTAISHDRRTLRRVKGEWPGGRGYELKVRERMIPEEVVRQIFERIEHLPPTLKRLLIIVRYTGMRAGDLHSLAFNCLADDPDDDKFMILSFYQSKVRKWNTKPLLTEDRAHQMVIKAIRDQQRDVLEEFGQTPPFLFAMRHGDKLHHCSMATTYHQMSKWCIQQGIRNGSGSLHRFGWHSFRHYYGTELALAGHDIALIQMELGHTSPEMSMVYVNQRLRLKKKALIEKGAGRFVDIKGKVDEKVGDLAVRKDAALAVDVPGGLCSMPAQIGEWCAHNRACFTCSFFRADIDQLPFFEREAQTVDATIQRLHNEVEDFKATGRTRMAEIGERRMAHNAEALKNLQTIIASVRNDGVYRGNQRQNQRPSCGHSAEECPSQKKGRDHVAGNAGSGPSDHV